jgi:hypothetical protein
MRRLRSVLLAPRLLLTFEAAGRLLSFTDVTRVAVSQQNRSPEKFLGSSSSDTNRAISAVLTEVDNNPLLVSPNGALAVDCLSTLVTVSVE